MQQDGASFWADIKRWEERLAEDPDSYLFASLVQVYLQVGLVDDALHTAKQGTARHPQFVAGQRSLAMACHAKGLHDECRQALVMVTTACPEDADSQKLLGRLLVAEGQPEAAMGCLRMLLDFHPDDTEARVELEALERRQAVAVPPAWEPAEAGFAFPEEQGEEDEIIEDIEILEMDETDVLDEEISEEAGPVSAVVAGSDPLSTKTLAELYVQQGYLDRALEIYRTLSAEDRSDAAVQARLAELEARKTAVPSPVAMGQDEAKTPEKDQPTAAPFKEDAPIQPATGVVAVLEGWLENIRRIRAWR